MISMNDMVPPFIKKDRSTYARSNLFVLASASCYSCAENVLMESVVVAELKFRHVVRKIFFANFIKRPDHTMLEDRPEALDGVGMNRANHVLTSCMMNDLVRILVAQLPVAHPLIDYEQTYLV